MVIGILCDASGSMEGVKIAMVRSIIYNIKKSTLKNKNIILKLWSFGGNELDAYIREYNSLEEIKFLSTDMYYPFTPTHLAVKYAVNKLNKIPGRKKFLIVLTDGMPGVVLYRHLTPTKKGIRHQPNGFVNEYIWNIVNRDILLELVRKEVIKGRKKGINIHSILILDDAFDKKTGRVDSNMRNMKIMFGSEKDWCVIGSNDPSKLYKVLNRDFVNCVKKGIR